MTILQEKKSWFIALNLSINKINCIFTVIKYLLNIIKHDGLRQVIMQGGCLMWLDQVRLDIKEGVREYVGYREASEVGIYGSKTVRSKNLFFFLGYIYMVEILFSYFFRKACFLFSWIFLFFLIESVFSFFSFFFLSLKCVFFLFS